MRRDACDMDLPATQVDEKEYVVGYQATQRPDLSSEEVGRHKDVHVRADELLPRGGGFALWGRGDAMAFQDVAHRLVTDRIAQVGQGADNTVIAPGAVFLGHADHQGFEVLGNRGASRTLALRRAIELLGHQLAMPAQNGVGLDDRGHFLQGLLAELLANLGQSFALAITQPYATFDLVSQHAIFGDEVLIA